MTEPLRLSDERVLEIVGETLTDFVGGEWTMRPGPLLKGPGSVGVRMGTSHDASYRHVDLEFLLSVDHPVQTSLINCAMGLAEDPEEAARQAVASWRDTTATVGLEMVTREGRYANHYGSTDAQGFPGWHTIVGSIVGWGHPDAARQRQMWFADNHPWTALAPLLLPELDRPELNGIRLLQGYGSGLRSAEVRINGRPNEDAAAALDAMDWPRTEKFGIAHLFLLLVHPDPKST